MKTITVKIKSFQHGNLSAAMNAQTEMLNLSLTEIKRRLYEEFPANDAQKTIKEYTYLELKNLLKTEGYSGQDVKMFSDVKGIASLTEAEIKKLKQYNLAIIGLRGKFF